MCLRSWLEDPDGDPVYELATTALPEGSYQAKAALNESRTENYGAGGAPGGANLGFTVPADGTLVRFRFVSAGNQLTITVPEPARPASLLAALATLALCCAGLDSRINRSQEPPA